MVLCSPVSSICDDNCYALFGKKKDWRFEWIRESGSICKIKSKSVRASLYYITITLLMLDPLYLSIICGFVGGGDMNGIKLIFPEIAVRAMSGVLFIINGFLFWKKVLPSYKIAFSE